LAISARPLLEAAFTYAHFLGDKRGRVFFLQEKADSPQAELERIWTGAPPPCGGADLLAFFLVFNSDMGNTPFCFQIDFYNPECYPIFWYLLC
jgi:hypothetical protein